jgi:hypothetical protein
MKLSSYPMIGLDTSRTYNMHLTNYGKKSLEIIREMWDLLAKCGCIMYTTIVY